ncbi:hypothetical protein T484DRAFT_1801584 [Baffinella frigidus]|nr:hypothetical protein T484DRAFT_1801584 [Cryptophyta sp. CCMP2293]
MVDQLNAGQLKQLHTTFQILDGDGDGRVDAADLQGFLATFNNKFSLNEVEAFINDESTQPDGVLDFPE